MSKPRRSLLDKSGETRPGKAASWMAFLSAPRLQASLAGVLLTVGTLSAANAQAVNCDAYARSYADAHTSNDPTDLSVVDGGMRGAVAGGAWEGPGGARRGAVAGGALAVLDTLGNYPGGWQGLYDLAYSTCSNQKSPVNHRPTTLGDPSYRPAPSPRRRPVPPLPSPPGIPFRQDP
ncbi:hypothetical protein CLV41_107185 [Roseibium marinum]|uniref:Uncharacterized protein n=1 Tax=Roseibium marinum TaxID=281252 RepID=A0A2S3UR23_9HYPH|nr:hypothetical protein CLV41_107185 [Roseibium marinum]